MNYELQKASFNNATIKENTQYNWAIANGPKNTRKTSNHLLRELVGNRLTRRDSVPYLLNPSENQFGNPPMLNSGLSNRSDDYNHIKQGLHMKPPEQNKLLSSDQDQRSSSKNIKSSSSL